MSDQKTIATLSILDASEMVIDQFSEVAGALARDGYQVQFSTTPLDGDLDGSREATVERIGKEIVGWFERRGGSIAPHELQEFAALIERVI